MVQVGEVCRFGLHLLGHAHAVDVLHQYIHALLIFVDAFVLHDVGAVNSVAHIELLIQRHA